MKPRYIRVVSDLHLEQYSGNRPEFNLKTFIPEDPRDAESVLVLAGDIDSHPETLYPFLQVAPTRFMHAIYVPGNHEFYGHDMDEWAKNLQALADAYAFPKLSLSTLGVGELKLENVRFIFTTLWGDGGKSQYEQLMVGKYLRDFSVIRRSGRGFKVPDMIELHKQQRAEVERLLGEPFDGVNVVVSHHMPSYRLCHPRFGTDANGGFASNMDLFLSHDTAPHIWIHGHTHDSIDTRLWKTRVVCNPSGYYFENDARYKNFKPRFLDLENLNEDREAQVDG